MERLSGIFLAPIDRGGHNRHAFGQEMMVLVSAALSETSVDPRMIAGIAHLMRVPSAVAKGKRPANLGITRNIAETQAIRAGLKPEEIGMAYQLARRIHDECRRLPDHDTGPSPARIGAQIRTILLAEGVVTPAQPSPVLPAWESYASGRPRLKGDSFDKIRGANPIAHLRSVT